MARPPKSGDRNKTPVPPKTKPSLMADIPTSAPEPEPELNSFFEGLGPVVNEQKQPEQPDKEDTYQLEENTFPQVTNLALWFANVQAIGKHHLRIGKPYEHKSGMAANTLFESVADMTFEEAQQMCIKHLSSYKGFFLLSATSLPWSEYNTRYDRKMSNPVTVWVQAPDVVKVFNMHRNRYNNPAKDDTDEIVRLRVENELLKRNATAQPVTQQPKPLDQLIQMGIMAITQYMARGAAPVNVAGPQPQPGPVQPQPQPEEHFNISTATPDPAQPDNVQVSIPSELYALISRWDELDTENNVTDLVRGIVNLKATQPELYAMALQVIIPASQQ